MPKERPEYLSYLLRLWRVSGETQAWRASLENSLTREFRGFGSVDELFAFLRSQTSVLPHTEGDTRGG